MKLNEEKNAYQKYDDLFIEQDKEYDRNNHNRYLKKKDHRRMEKEIPSTEQKKKQQRSLLSSVISLIIFGGLINYFFMDSTMNRAWLSPVIIFVIVMFVISKSIKNK